MGHSESTVGIGTEVSTVKNTVNTSVPIPTVLSLYFL